MSDYHTVYKGPEGQTTQWDDIQVKLGNKAPVPKPAKAEAWSDPGDRAVRKDTQWLDSKTEVELGDLDDEFDDDRFLDEYRRQRMQELRRAAAVQRFGSVLEIGSADFVREVTQAGADVWVVVLLYKDGVPECALLNEQLDVLAARFPATKFLRIISTHCIPQYPDRNLPTVLLYKDTKCLQTLVGLLPYGGRRLTSEQVAFAFNRLGPVCRTAGETDQEVSEGDIKALLQKLASVKAAECDAALGPDDE